MANSNTNAPKNGFGRFFKEARAEVKKVVWPNKKELINYTAVVFITVLIVSVILGIVDTIFSRLFQLLLHMLG